MSGNRLPAAQELLETLTSDGVRLWSEEGSLKYWSPQGPLNTGLLGKLKMLKPELLRLTAGDHGRTKGEPRRSALIRLREGCKPPLFCIHSISGGANFYNKFDVRRPVDEEPVEMIGVSAMGVYESQKFPDRLEDLATQYAQEIEGAVSDGPVNLCGYSMGGNLAYEIARQLVECGRKVATVILIDSPFRTPTDINASTFDWLMWSTFINICLGRVPAWAETPSSPLYGMAEEQRIDKIHQEITGSEKSNFPKTFTRENLKSYHAFFMKLNELRTKYEPQTYNGNVVFLSASKSPNTETIDEWSRVCTRRFRVEVIPGLHNELFRDQQSLSAISTCLSKELNARLRS
jgi:thioesterase domain-containing protein